MMTNKRALVVGGSRGLGKGAVISLEVQGYEVTTIGRDAAHLLPRHLVGDATDESLAGRALTELRPELLVLVAGAAPPLGPFHQMSWDQFQTNWNVDTRLAFVWLKQALGLPLPSGSHLIVVASGAAVQGSPVSGGYAAAKRAQWFLAQYAATEIERAKLGMVVHCLLPNLNPSSEMGRAAITAYSRRAGVSEEEFSRRFQPYLTPEIFGRAVAGLAASPEKYPQLAYRLSGDGLAAVS
jgi:NAD(P)-dependent dehydrogenase (short-subunit alcohol dehydrogenase family)